MYRWIIGIIILALGIAVGWYSMRGDSMNIGRSLGIYPPVTSTPTPTGAIPSRTSSDMPSGSSKGGGAERVVVMYTPEGFGPTSVMVRSGMTVTFMNESDSPMWVASAVHPTHDVLPGFDQKASVGRGGSYEFTFQNVGTWQYHNHMNPSQVGVVVVQQ